MPRRTPGGGAPGARADVGAADSAEPARPNPFTLTTDLPRSVRGARTREALVRAARGVFERDGFLGARVTDIADDAGVAHGSFYTHFATKEQVFAAVVAELNEEMLHPRVDHGPDPVATIEAANRGYLEAYARNARLMALLEEVASMSDDLRALRRERADAFTERNARSIRALQDQGLADPDLDPWTSATALSSMVSRMAALTFVHDQRLDPCTVARTVTRLWVNALRLPAGQGAGPDA